MLSRGHIGAARRPLRVFGALSLIRSVLLETSLHTKVGGSALGTGICANHGRFRFLSSSTDLPPASTDPETAGSESSSSSELDSKAKRLASRRQYIVLGARKSRLLPAKKRPVSSPTSETRIDAVEEQRQLLMKFKTNVTSEDALFSNIDLMKPMNRLVSPKRFNQLSSDLHRDYNKHQLIRYYNHYKPTDLPKESPNSIRKKQLVNKILMTVWNLEISQDVKESADVITERVVQLTKRELFTVISNNGQLPRSWTKSGAKVFILVDEQKIVLRATEETINWIMVSLHTTLRNVVSRSVDCSNIEKITPVMSLPLNRIQQLSNTYLEFNEKECMLRATSTNYEQTSYSLRLLIDAIADQTRKAIDCFYPGGSENTRYSRVIDDDAMTWKERSFNWFRLKNIKTKKTKTGLESDLTKEQQKKGDQEYLPDPIVDQITDNMVGSAGMTEYPTTLTATFGYLLHRSDDKSPSNVANPESPKTFFTNIPFLYNTASKLRLYDPEVDMHHSNELVDDLAESGEPINDSPEPVVTDEKPENTLDAWNRLLEIALRKNSTTPELNPKGAQEGDHTYLVQIKFLPNIFKHSTEGTSQYPPLELWFEVENDEIQLSSLQFAATEKEVASVVSLPSQKADIKFTNTVSRFLDKSQPGVQRFCSEIRINFSKDNPVYIPKYLNGVDIGGGKQVDYIYHGLVYRRQIDLAYKNYIFQLSTLEGGLFGGRRLEANLVLDSPEGTKDLSPEAVRDFVQTAHEFAKSI